MSKHGNAAESPRQICLVSPGHVSFNPRLVKEANALHDAGYRVHVIAAGNVSYLRDFDSAIFANAGWTWETVSYSNRYHHQFLRIRRKCARFLVRIGVRNLTIMALAHHVLAAPLARAVLRRRADLYIAHYIAAIPVVAAAAARYRAFAGFDAEDFHTGEFEDARKASLDATIVEALERAYLPSFVHFTAASPGIAAAYGRMFPGVAPLPILNVFPLAQAPLRPTATMQRAKGQLAAHWFSQTIGDNRGLEAVLLALSLTTCRVDFYVRGTWQQGYRQKFEALAERLGVLDRVHQLPLVAPTEIERSAAVYDIGLVSETGHSYNRQIALTNKIFSYMLAGLVVVATDIEAHRAIKSDGTKIEIYAADDAVGLAAIFDRLGAKPIELFELRMATWSAGQGRYNWDIEAKNLVQSIHNILEKIRLPSSSA